MKIDNTRIGYEKKEDYLRVDLPVTRQLIPMIVFSVLMIVWVGMLFVSIRFLFRPPFDEALNLSISYRLLWIFMMIIWLYIWGKKIGKTIWYWFQFHLAKKEVMYLSDESLIIRRPLSILGVTNGFKMAHISPFYKHDKYQSPAFQYGNVHHELFGLGLEGGETDVLIDFLNERYFPDMEEESEEDVYELPDEI